MSLYPSLEDMVVDKMAKSQVQHLATIHQAQQPGEPNPAQGPPPAYGAVPAHGAAAPSQPQGAGSLYPSLNEYMGLQIVPTQGGMQVSVPSSQGSSHTQLIAPVTGNDVGLRRAEIKQGVREVLLCKDGEGKMGLRVKSVQKGLFVAFVHAGSPASLAGLRFGDQILQIDGEYVAGWDTDKAMNFIKKKCDPKRITMALRDRPFERTITLQKDSNGYVGFVFDGGKITAIVKDSSAARNGLLIDHQLVEINGQNVMGLKDKETKTIIDSQGRSITVTIMPSFIYDHMVKCIGSSLLKKHMDHSIPEL